MCLLAALLAWSGPAQRALAQGGSNIAATKHNLTVSGPGPIRVAGQTEVCKFCHTPHAANPIAPLWNRYDPGAYYKTYESSTLVAKVGQPTGSSRLCLSCHDGTIALTQTYNSRNAPGTSIFITSADRGYIGTDLSDDHPISFLYDSSLAAQKGQLLDPAMLPRQLALDPGRQLQCTTCHDPHDDKFGKFLTMDNSESRMCQTCHRITGWTSSSHSTSPASLAMAQGDKWDNIRATTVRGAACESCHRPHSAGGRQRLLRRELEKDNCLSCHDGTVASKNIAAALQRVSAHPVGKAPGVHDPTENPRTMSPHVECADCHNTHRSAATPAARAPYLKPSMLGAVGVASTGVVATATYEYEVCFKCHGARNVVRSYLVDRVLVNNDLSDLFSPANPGFHPVETRGKNSNVPSLVQNLTTASIIYCTDCHSAESTSNGAGPHGSAYRPLLVRNYVVADNTPESQTAYALCYGCHNRSSILADRSFPDHKKHIVDKKTPCSVCHDPHGVSARQAPSQVHLMNFDKKVVLPSRSTGKGPSYTSSGTFRGSCTLYCHGKDHVNMKYPG
jgi:predicted CXXCH cytochrome family protein